MAQLMFKIANEVQPDIRTVNPQVPDCLAAIIERALCKDMAQRYQTGDEMAKDLRACIGQVPAAEASASPAEIDIQF
jgi:serine/threonine-protein kinase